MEKSLTKRQKEVMEKIWGKIENAKNLDPNEWGRKIYCHQWDRMTEETKARELEEYDNLRNNISLTWESGRTLRALEKKGYIEILVDATNRNTVDTVRVLKFS